MEGRADTKRLFCQPPVGKAGVGRKLDKGIAVAVVAEARFPWRNSMELRHTYEVC